MKRIFILISIMLSFLAYGEGHENVATTDGAFTTLMVAAPDIDKYVQTLKANTSAFAATGATGAGVCVTKSGNEYDGQMMVWSAFPSVEAALIGSLNYDPQKANPALYSFLKSNHQLLLQEKNVTLFKLTKQ